MNTGFLISVTKAIVSAMPVTLYMTGIVFITALIFSVILAMIDTYKIPVLSQICSAYVSFFRGTPLIPQLFLLYFGLPTFFSKMRGIPSLVVCCVALTLNSAAYMREVVRGALLSVPVGQKEAALAHGMTSLQAMLRIILPQATRVAIPSLFNNLVDIVKGTSVAFTIGVLEMTAVADLRASVTFNYFEAYIVLMLLYWLIILVLEKIASYIEKRIAKKYER